MASTLTADIQEVDCSDAIPDIDMESIGVENTPVNNEMLENSFILQVLSDQEDNLPYDSDETSCNDLDNEDIQFFGQNITSA
jgi:hypothetical protein